MPPISGSIRSSTFGGFGGGMKSNNSSSLPSSVGLPTSTTPSVLEGLVSCGTSNQYLTHDDTSLKKKAEASSSSSSTIASRSGSGGGSSSRKSGRKGGSSNIGTSKNDDSSTNNNDPRRKSLLDSYKKTQEIINLQKQLKMKDDKITTLTNAVSNMESKMKQVETIIAQFEDDTTNSKEELEKEIDVLKATNSSLQKELQDKNAELEFSRKNNEYVSPNIQRYVQSVRENSMKFSKDEKTVHELRGFFDNRNQQQHQQTKLSREEEEIIKLKEKIDACESKTFKDSQTIQSLQEEIVTLNERLKKEVGSKKLVEKLLNDEITVWKQKCYDVDAKRIDDKVGEMTRYQTMEQKFLAQNHILKCRIVEFEKLLANKDAEHIKEEQQRSIRRKQDIQRLQTLEKLRKAKYQVEMECTKMEDTIIELRTKLATSIQQQQQSHTPPTIVVSHSWAAGAGVSSPSIVTPSGADSGAGFCSSNNGVGGGGESKIAEEDEDRQVRFFPPIGGGRDQSQQPKNITRLRNKLNMARARLSAARGHQHIKKQFATSFDDDQQQYHQSASSSLTPLPVPLQLPPKIIRSSVVTNIVKEEEEQKVSNDEPPTTAPPTTTATTTTTPATDPPSPSRYQFYKSTTNNNCPSLDVTIPH